MGTLTAAQWKELVFYVVFGVSLFCMVWFGGVVPLLKKIDDRGRRQSEAAAKRWMARREEERQVAETGYEIMKAMKDILK